MRHGGDGEDRGPGRALAHALRLGSVVAGDRAAELDARAPRLDEARSEAHVEGLDALLPEEDEARPDREARHALRPRVGEGAREHRGGALRLRGGERSVAEHDLRRRLPVDRVREGDEDAPRLAERARPEDPGVVEVERALRELDVAARRGRPEVERVRGATLAVGRDDLEAEDRAPERVALRDRDAEVGDRLARALLRGAPVLLDPPAAARAEVPLLDPGRLVVRGGVGGELHAAEEAAPRRPHHRLRSVLESDGEGRLPERERVAGPEQRRARGLEAEAVDRGPVRAPEVGHDEPALAELDPAVVARDPGLPDRARRLPVLERAPDDVALAHEEVPLDRLLRRVEDADDGRRDGGARPPPARHELGERRPAPGAREPALVDYALEGRVQLVGVGTRRRVLREELEHERRERARHVSRERRRLPLDDLAEAREDGVSREGRHAGEAAVGRAPEGEEVGPLVHRVALDLLRGHVVDRPDRQVLGGRERRFV